MKISITLSDASVIEAAAIVNLLAEGQLTLTVADDFVHGVENKNTVLAKLAEVLVPDAKLAPAKVKHSPALTPDLSKPPKQKRKRRTKSEMVAEAELKVAKDAEAKAMPDELEKEPELELGGDRRQRVAAAAQADAPKPEEAPKRRRQPGGAGPADPEASPELEEAPKRRRQPEGAGPAAGAETITKVAPNSVDDDGINDSDLAKAASLAAEALSTDTVMGVLKEFGVNNVRLLDQDQRADFIAILDLKVEADGKPEIPF